MSLRTDTGEHQEPRRINGAGAEQDFTVGPQNDAAGQANGVFTADTFVGTQLPPSEAGAEIKPGMSTAGIGIYEGDKLANAKDGSLTPLAEGKHKLALHISSRAAPK